MEQDKNLRGNSENWANRMSRLSPTTCKPCENLHGKIEDISVLQGKEEVDVTIDAHPNEKCILVKMRTKQVETATNKGTQGADAYLFFLHRLPPEYVDKKTAAKAGWDRFKGNLDTVLPGKSIGGDVYRNNERKLPHKEGRIWHEADINYTGGYRNHDRVLYSDDGLIFITYDRYHTYYELTK